MKAQAWISCAIVSVAIAGTHAWAGVGPTFCMYSPDFGDNLTIKADVSENQLRIDRESSFRVYLHNTMNHPFWSAKLEVISDQFDATITPSTTWKTYPDVQPVMTGGTREYFTVTLKRKAGTPDGKYDVAFKVYSAAHMVPKLAVLATVSEAADQHEIPFKAALTLDGKPRAQDWTQAPTLTGFSAYNKRGAGYGYLKPADQTRIRVAANDESLYMLVSCLGLYDRSTKGNALKIYLSPGVETKPTVLTLDESTGTIEGLPGVECVKCPADPDAGDSVASYELRIPRKAAGIETTSFFLNFCRTVTGRGASAETSFWRGNEASVNDAVVYARMVVGGK